MEPTTDHAIRDKVSIHHLPPELLCNVFKDARKKRDYRSLFAIRSVCKRWLEVVDSSPELWAFVSLRHNESLLDMILQKSKNRLLSIEYKDTLCANRDSSPSGWRANFKARIVPLAHRWARLDVHTTSFRDDLFWALSLQLQNLETLRVHALTLYPHPLHAPKLQSVIIGGLFLDWGSLSDLRTFILTRPIPWLSLKQVYVLLTNCLRLEILRVDGSPSPLLRLLPSNSGTSNPTAPVFLPHLRSLILYEVADDPYHHLLSLIDAPNLRRLFFSRVVSLHESMESWNPRFSPLAPFLGSDVHSLNTNRLGIKGSKYSFALSLGACDLLYHHINGQRWVGRTGNFLSTLSAVFSEFDARVRNSIKVIHFAGTRSREDLRILGPILHRHFPNVEELLVTLSASEGSSDANFVLEALASPLPLEDETGWLFPGLTTLRLKARRKAVYDGVMGVIEARRSGGVQAIQRVSIKNGRIGRDAAAKLKATVPDFCMTGTRYIDTESAVA